MESKRINVFNNGSSKDGKAVLVTGPLEEALKIICEQLHCDVTVLYTAKGGLIQSFEAIRDDEVLHASCGEPFEAPLSQDKQEGMELRTGSHSDWVTLNVGGKAFTTTRSTLVRNEPGNMLARMFTDDRSVQWHSAIDHTGAYLIDRSPIYFEPVLNYLRHGTVVIDKGLSKHGVLEEARFFGVTSLAEKLEVLVKAEAPATDFTAMGRRDVMSVLMGTTADQELRFQGMNFAGADLSMLDLRHVNFKYANLEGASLKGATLNNCNFERANLTSAVLDNSQLLGVKLLCAQLEGASMRACNFEDPAGSRANMEGANMKSVCLEGSQMAGANLRVACLRGANLRNCDLRAAVLAGADMENVNLSGCDLQEANLRGANLKDALLELMLHPLHMSQTVP